MNESLSLSPYHAYVLRFWPECQGTTHPQWRFTLLDPKTGEQRGFATLEALMAYLAQLTENSAPSPASVPACSQATPQA